MLPQQSSELAQKAAALLKEAQVLAAQANARIAAAVQSLEQAASEEVEGVYWGDQLDEVVADIWQDSTYLEQFDDSEITALVERIEDEIVQAVRVPEDYFDLAEALLRRVHG